MGNEGHIENISQITANLAREARKGRGAASNRAGRYERFAGEACDDGWGSLEEPLDKLRTTIQADKSRTAITRNDSPDLGFDRSINAYRGCEHGCSYCFARPTHAFLGLSPGQDFETRIFAKYRAPELLRQELSQPGYSCRMIALGTNTDPYQPAERRLEITRAILEILSEFNHPVGIVTKSALITRDVDILSSMAERNLVKTIISVTTLERDLARRMEPRAATPAKRLAAIRTLSCAGIPTGVNFAPVIPALNESELEAVFEAAAEAGACEAAYILLRLPLEITDLFKEWLLLHAPNRARHVMSRMRDMHAGKHYRSEFGLRQTGSGPSAELLGQRFRLAKKKYGLDNPPLRLDASRFCPPPQTGDQLTLI
ncbi:MAG: PA0069 family radical SAM protein [Rhodospirillaceae bacterium]|nr:PA0069 family radical SAM protein [Rhodospirillaceae bacterium]